MRLPASSLAIALLIHATADAQVTRHVPSQFASIQSAINASTHGDLILVAPGIYNESISFGGRNLTLRSSAGPDVTIISAAGLDRRVVTFGSGESNAATLDGFTIRDGHPVGGQLTQHGGGILCCWSSRPTIINCIVRDNRAELGGGIYICSNASQTRIGDTSFCNNLCYSGYGFDIAQGFVNLGNVTACAECGCDAGPIVQWGAEAGGNGHWYQAKLQAGWIGWDNALADAAAVGADLVAVESASEQAFVHDLLRPYSIAYWIGLSQEPEGPEPAGGWAWSSGSELSYLNWGTNQPDNGNSNQHFGAMRLDGTWNDFRVDGETYSNRLGIRGWVVEWSADCNGDGIVDYGQILDGTLSDKNANGVLDCCEQGVPCAVANNPVQWRFEDGGNGHWYEIVVQKDSLTWHAADAFAGVRGGHLVTVTSEGESIFVSSLLGTSGPWWISTPEFFSSSGPFLGGYRTSLIDPWQWTTGEMWEYEAWCSNQPSNSSCTAAELVLHAKRGDFCDGDTRWWGDVSATAECPSEIDGIRSYVIEWSADCNADGIVDYGQIFDGTLSDKNANGVPDCCDLNAPLVTPTQAPFGASQPLLHTFSEVRPAAGPVTLRIDARADLGTATRFVTVRLDGQVVATAWVSDGQSCPESPAVFTTTVSSSVFNALVEDGVLEVSLQPSTLTSTKSCPESFAAVTLDYQRDFPDCDGNGVDDSCELAEGILLDCNGNGTPDSCEVAQGTERDCDGDGVPDSCQLALDPMLDKDGDGVLDSCQLGRGDLNLDGVVDGADLGALLSLWGTPNPPIGDLNGDGTIDGADLGILLSNWGPVKF